jgi:hypothetical protein
MREKGYPKYKSITRLDYPHKHLFGWLVRVSFKGQIISRYFMDAQYDSPEEALEAALDFRNETERELGKLRSERIVVTRNARNRSGAIGVRRRWKRTRNDRGKLVEGFEVTWCPEPGKMGRTFVSIRKYGEEGAFQRACEIRKAKECLYLAEDGCVN